MIKIESINKEEIFERISNGIPFDKKLRPYSEIQINLVMKFFLEKEEYEKCQVIKSFIENRFNHNNNYNF